MEVNWPQLLQDYGPFALLPFVILVIERTAARRAHDVDLPEKTRNRAYAAAWIMIFTLCVLVVIIWSLNRPRTKEAMMRGKITGLSVRQRLRGTGPDTANVRVFTYRDPQQPDQLFWRTFSTDPLDEQTELAFLIDSSTKDSDETLRFAFHASQAYYSASRELHFRYDATKKKLIFQNPETGKTKELDGERIVIAASASSGQVNVRPFLSVVAVMAQAKLSLGDVMANLESDDPLIRLTARKQLASLGAEATDTMDNALRNGESSYRVKLGVIVAANQMPGFRPEAFSTLAWCGVWRAVQSGDETMKAQANRLLKKQRKPIDTSLCNEKRLRQDQRRAAEKLEAHKSISPRNK